MRPNTPNPLTAPVGEPKASEVNRSEEGPFILVVGADELPESMAVLRRRSELENARLLWPVKMMRSGVMSTAERKAREEELVRLQVEGADVVLLLAESRDRIVQKSVKQAAADFGKLIVSWPNPRFGSLEGLFEFVVSYCRTYGSPSAKLLVPVKKRRRSFKSRATRAA